MKMRVLVLTTVAAGVVGAAAAATATADFEVRLEIVSECLINSVTDLDFGSHGVIAADLDAISTITVQCTESTPYTLGISAGGGAGATVGTRYMTGPAAQTVAYTLYRDPGRTQVWGTTIGNDTFADTGDGAAQAVTVYGRVPAQTTPGVGVYSDTVTATITY